MAARGAGGARRQQSEQKSRRLGEGGDKWPSRSHASKRVKIRRKESIVPKRRTSVERTDGMARSRKALSTPSGHAIATDWIRTQERLCCWQVDAQSVGRLVAVRRPSGHRLGTISAQGDGIDGPELTAAAVPPVLWPQKLKEGGHSHRGWRMTGDVARIAVRERGAVSCVSIRGRDTVQRRAASCGARVAPPTAHFVSCSSVNQPPAHPPTLMPGKTP